MSEITHKRVHNRLKMPKLNTQASTMLLNTLKHKGIVSGWGDFVDNGNQVKLTLYNLHSTVREGDLYSMVTNIVLWEVAIRDLLLPTLNYNSKVKLIQFFSTQNRVNAEGLSMSRQESAKYIQVPPRGIR